jgi:RNA polymerase sigma-70 factor (ECF subfamily)
MAHLERAAAGQEPSAFHLQAGIAACHCLARTYEETDWVKILSLYDLLLKINASPVAALNRAVALAKVRGSAAGLKALDEIKNPETLRRYYLFYAVRAEFCAELGRPEEASETYRQALSLTEIPAEREFLMRQLGRSR